MFDVPDETALQRAFATRAGVDADLFNRRIASWHQQQSTLLEWYKVRFNNVKRIDVNQVASVVSGRLTQILLEVGLSKEHVVADALQKQIAADALTNAQLSVVEAQGATNASHGHDTVMAALQEYA